MDVEHPNWIKPPCLVVENINGIAWIDETSKSWVLEVIAAFMTQSSNVWRWERCAILTHKGRLFRRNWTFLSPWHPTSYPWSLHSPRAPEQSLQIPHGNIVLLLPSASFGRHLFTSTRLAGGFNPFEKYYIYTYISQMDHFPKYG